MANPNGPAKDAGLPPDLAEVRRLLDSGDVRQALEAAKALHRRANTAASEALVVEAYTGRVRAMLTEGMEAESKALVEMLKQRFPASAPVMDALLRAFSFDEKVRPLGDPAASPEARTAAEQFLRTGMTDPALLAQCQSLPPEHTLRQGAGAIQKALEAVTTRPVTDEALTLPEISRRGPLASWKFLVRAIACYYRHEDEACAAHLRAIDPESAPARLVPVMKSLLADGEELPASPSARALVTRVYGQQDDVRKSLKDLEKVFTSRPGRKRLTAMIRQTTGVVQSQCPEILAAYRQQVAVRCMMQNLSPEAVTAALGGPPKSDAQFWLLGARMTEMVDELAPMACHMWEQFRQAAIDEKWFPAQGPEAATLYLHMAEIASKTPGDDDDNTFDPDLDDELESLLPDHTAMPYLRPSWLFGQACSMDPSSETFQRWVEWAEKRSQTDEAEMAAENWRKALPQDPRPLLRLMRYAEDRNALKKALGFLRQAEALDGVNAEVRRARLRLLISGAVRHLKQRKPRLAYPELAELESLPQAREHDRPAFLSALRFVALQIAGENEKMLSAAAQTKELLGSKLAGAMGLAAVASLCGLHMGIDLNATGHWLEAIPRVIAMGQDLGFRFMLPEACKPQVFKELKDLRNPDAVALERLGKAASYQNWNDLAYRISAIGLELGAAWEARFLLLRAAALPGYDMMRREECMMAALTLARRSNDPQTAEEALSVWRETSMGARFGIEPHLMEHHEVQKVLKRERKAREFGQSFSLDPEEFFAGGPFGPPPRRRRGRRRPTGDDDVPF